MRTRGRTGLIVALAGAALLAGCQRQPEPAGQPEPFNDGAEAPARPVAPARPEKAEPAPRRLPDAGADSAGSLPPETPVSADEQMQEDAEATGLTARTASSGTDRDPPADQGRDPVGDLISSNGLGN